MPYQDLTYLDVNAEKEIRAFKWDSVKSYIKSSLIRVH